MLKRQKLIYGVTRQSVVTLGGEDEGISASLPEAVTFYALVWVVEPITHIFFSFFYILYCS